MNPVRTEFTNHTLRGAPELDIADLPCERFLESTKTVWQPDAIERAKIAGGANIELFVYGDAHPPVSLSTTSEKVLG